ncbi:MAG: serine/threonine-protein phosphatase [Hungatella sp.]|nr:serine/threonine-protein phosphatase [Hungatella sp.]
MKIQYTSFCETGLVRQENQDAVFCGTDGTAGLFVVADGMGGHQDGARASSTIKEKASEWWKHYGYCVKRPAFSQVIEELRETFSKANEEIYFHTEAGAICGSTLVALWLDKDGWVLFSCGDSRCYHAKSGILGKRFVQLTTDDVWENQPENVQGMTRQQVEDNENFGFLVNAVGIREDLQYSIQSDSCKGKNLFLLCSDGVYKYCPEESLKRFSFSALRSKKPDTMSRGIWEQVLQNGAGDNLSLVLVMAEN